MDKKKATLSSFVLVTPVKKGTFNEFKQEFIATYSSLTITDFKQASQSILAIQLSTESMLCVNEKLENMSRAIVEASLKNEALTKGEFNDKRERKLTGSTSTTEESTFCTTAFASTQLLYLLDVMQISCYMCLSPAKVTTSIYHFFLQTVTLTVLGGVIFLQMSDTDVSVFSNGSTLELFITTPSCGIFVFKTSK